MRDASDRKRMKKTSDLIHRPGGGGEHSSGVEGEQGEKEDDENVSQHSSSGSTEYTNNETFQLHLNSRGVEEELSFKVKTESVSSSSSCG